MAKDISNQLFHLTLDWYQLIEEITFGEKTKKHLATLNKVSQGNPEKSLSAENRHSSEERQRHPSQLHGNRLHLLMELLRLLQFHGCLPDACTLRSHWPPSPPLMWAHTYNPSCYPFLHRRAPFHGKLMLHLCHEGTLSPRWSINFGCDPAASGTLIL